MGPNGEYLGSKAERARDTALEELPAVLSSNSAQEPLSERPPGAQSQPWASLPFLYGTHHPQDEASLLACLS